MSFKRLLAASTILVAAFALPSSASVQYRINSESLKSLALSARAPGKLLLERIPIDGKLATLEVESFEVFAPDADIKVMGANDAILERLPIPNIRTFRGQVSGDSESAVFLAVAPERIDGIILTGDRRFAIGSRRYPRGARVRDERAVDVFIQETDVLDDIPTDGRGFSCDADGVSIPRIPTSRKIADSLIPQTDGALSTATARWVINMAVETDFELYVNVGSSTSNVTSFITNLIGAMSTIYSREILTEVTVSSLTINSSVSDPFTVVTHTNGTWNGSPVTYTTTHALLEFGDRWHNSPPSAQPRSVTALISGKDVAHGAGVAWVDWIGQDDFFFDPNDNSCPICLTDPYKGHWGGRYSYNGGISPGNPPLVPDPEANAPAYTAPGSNYWPLLQISHETGHNVFSGHTHCRTLDSGDQVIYGRVFVDQCSSGEIFNGSACYSGGVSVPAEKGTIMSYCHLLGGGAQTRFIFGKPGEANYLIPNDLKAAMQNASPSLSAITAPSSLSAGASGSASVTNSPGLTYLWVITNGVINSGQGTNAINFTANANPTTVRVKATNTASNHGPQGQTGVSITDSKDITVIEVSYNAPTNVAATATSSTSVSVTWTVATGTAPVQYDVYRSSNGTTFTQLGFTAHPGTNFNDNTASAGVAYLYKVRSAGAGSTNESADSNRDLATTAVYTDDPVVSSSTLIKRAHVTELRAAVDAVRTLAGLTAGTYTDPTLTAGATLVKASHIADLRAALDAARAALSLSAISYGAPVTTSTVIAASHITELRMGVR